jgi:hypothetical protein
MAMKFIDHREFDHCITFHASIITYAKMGIQFVRLGMRFICFFLTTRAVIAIPIRGRIVR